MPSRFLTIAQRRHNLSADMRSRLAKRSVIYTRFFLHVFKRMLRNNFNAVRLANRPSVAVLRAPSLVIYSNHASWWDGILFLFVGRHLIDDRPVFTPMDAAMVKRYGFFQRLGAFGIEKDRAIGVKRFVEGCRLILAEPRNALLMAAQGHFSDIRQRPLTLDPGIAHIAKIAPGVTFLPLAVEHSFWLERRPEMLLRFGQPIRGIDVVGRPRAHTLQLLERALADAMDRLAVNAISRDLGAFEVLLSGRSGINPVYDAWRRLHAVLQRRRYRAHHGVEP